MLNLFLAKVQLEDMNVSLSFCWCLLWTCGMCDFYRAPVTPVGFYLSSLVASEYKGGTQVSLHLVSWCNAVSCEKVKRQKMRCCEPSWTAVAETEQRNQQPTVVQSDTDSANFAWRIMMVWWTYPSEGFLKVAFTEREIFNQLLKTFPNSS